MSIFGGSKGPSRAQKAADKKASEEAAAKAEANAQAPGLTREQLSMARLRQQAYPNAGFSFMKRSSGFGVPTSITGSSGF